MSGLEPLVALGLACNILQIVDTVKQSVSICRNILESGSVDPALNTRVQDLTKICEELKSRQHVATGASCTAEQQELVALAQSTITTATELKSAIDKLSGRTSKGKLLDAVNGTLKTAWRRRTLERLEKNLLDTQRILETRLLVRICSQNDALAIKQREEFSTLGDQLRTFISNYEQGNRDMESLLRDGFASFETRLTAEATKTRHDLSTKIEHLAVTLQDRDLETHVTAEATQTRNEISTKIEDLKVVVKDKDNEDVKRLLASLRYPSMNERRNQISVAHEGTFDWIFGSEPSSSDSDESSVMDSGDDADSNAFHSEPESEDESESINLSESERNQPRHDPVFVNWLQSPEQPLFWISGKPGAGKSTLMKFILEDDRTRDCLNRAQPNTLLISHFIWSAGDLTQRSLKGLLCSLLHQLMTGIKDAPNLLLGVGKISQVDIKESPGDWSVYELQVGLFSILKRLEIPVCILVDGLDELDKADGPFVLLEVITQIRDIPGVKVLVSSRPERAFLSRFETEPFLGVQDLTRRGIFRYCRDRLALFVDTDFSVITAKSVQKLAKDLSFRAEGVFLWASLALKSLERGISNGDSVEYLHERLEGLPDDLNLLYQNMWDRLNEDKGLYREEAAKYFNLVLVCLDIIERSEELNDLGENRFQPYAIAQLLALDARITDQILGEGAAVTEEDILSIYDKFSAFLEAITVRCAGILEIQPHDLGEDYYEPGVDILFVTVGFVHRSAREFLCNTIYGQEILQHDRSTPQDRFGAFLKACLARDVILQLLDPRFYSAPFGNLLEAQQYTALCCDPTFGLSLRELVDVMKCVEKYQVITSRSMGESAIVVGHVGTLILKNCPEAALFALEQTEKSNRVLSATYLGYLLVVAIHMFSSSKTTTIGPTGEQRSKPTMISTLVNWRGVDINARTPVIEFDDYNSPPLPRTQARYANSPLFNAFLSSLFTKSQHQVLSSLVYDIVQACDMFLELKPRLEMRSLLILYMYSLRLGTGEWRIGGLGFPGIHAGIHDNCRVIVLEVDTGFCLRLLRRRLEAELKEDHIVLQNSALFRSAIVERPGRIEVLGVRRAVMRRGHERMIVPLEQANPGFVKALEGLRWVSREGEQWHLEIPGYPTAESLIAAFEHETREITMEEFEGELTKRKLIVTSREVNRETWPPPRYD